MLMLWLGLASCTSHKAISESCELNLQETKVAKWILADTLFLNTQIAPIVLEGDPENTSIKVRKNFDSGLTAASNTPKSPAFIPLAIRHTSLSHQDTTRSTTASHWQQTKEKTPVEYHRLDMFIVIIVVLMVLCGLVSLVIMVSTRSRRD